MSVRKSGAWCDVCNNPQPLNPTTGFKIESVSPTMMHSCDDCLPRLNEWNEMRVIENLPEGPFRRLIEKAQQLNQSEGDGDVG